MLNATKTLKTKLANTVARFKADEKGNFAILAATTMAVLVAGLAVSVDAANGQFAKQRLQDTTDAIALFCLLYTSPSPRDKRQSRMPSSA